WAVATPPAHMEADPVLRHAFERVVDHFDAELELLAVLLDTPVRVEHPRRGELRLVDLDDEAGVGDGCVLFADRFGHGHHVRLFAGVVLVASTGTQTEWTERSGERFSAFACDGGFEGGHV